jgi:hypothetical protein
MGAGGAGMTQDYCVKHNHYHYPETGCGYCKAEQIESETLPDKLARLIKENPGMPVTYRAGEDNSTAHWEKMEYVDIKDEEIQIE